MEDNSDRASLELMSVCCADYENLHRIKELIRSGADANVLTDNSTPLCNASYEGHEDLVELLLEHGASLDVTDGRGRTPLYLAAENGQHHVLQLLLQRGSSVNTRDNGGMTSLETAVVNGHLCVADELLVNGAEIVNRNDDNHSSRPSESDRAIQIVEIFLRQRGFVDARNKQGKTLLFCAIRTGMREVAKILLARGADVNAQNSDGSCPLNEATIKHYQYNNSSLCLLIEHGANVNISLSHQASTSTLEFAMRKQEIELILDAGPSPYYYRTIDMDPDCCSCIPIFRHPCWMFVVRKWVAAGFPVDVWLQLAADIRTILSTPKPTRYYARRYKLTEEGILNAVCKLEGYARDIRAIVPCLHQLSRTRIRHELVFSKTRGHIRQKIEELALPGELKSFLNLDDLQCENEECKCPETYHRSPPESIWARNGNGQSVPNV